MDYYNSLLSTLSKEELEDSISKKIKEFHDYISRDAAIKIIAKEKGLYKEETTYSKIKEIKSGSNSINLKAKIHSIEKLQTYPSGKKSRAVTLEDDSGKIQLVLWEEDISLLDKLRINDEIEVLGVYEKFGRVNLGYKGKIKIINKKGFSSLDSLEENFPCNVKGSVLKNKNHLLISDGVKEIEFIFEEGTDRSKTIETGDEIILENVLFSKSLLVIGSNSRIFVKKSKNILSGKISSASLEEGDSLRVQIGEKEILLDKENSLKFLSIDPSTTLSLPTLLELKKESFLGKRAFVRFKNKEAHTIIEKIVLN